MSNTNINYGQQTKNGDISNSKNKVNIKKECRNTAIVVSIITSVVSIIIAEIVLHFFGLK